MFRVPVFPLPILVKVIGHVMNFMLGVTVSGFVWLILSPESFERTLRWWGIL